MKKFLVLVSVFLLASCASVGPVEITQDDNVYTVLSALFVALIFWYLKTWIEYRFRLRLKRKIKKEELD